MKPPGHYENIPDRLRYRYTAYVAILFSIPVVVFVSSGVTSISDGYFDWIAATVFALLGGLFVFLIYRKKQVFVPDPPPPPTPIAYTEEELKEKAEAAEKWERIEKAWWYRYPVAGLVFFGAWLLYLWRPNLWWVSMIAVLYGLTLAKEIGLAAFYIALAGFGIYAMTAIFGGIASLPVSSAIIIGAIIIAFAVSR